jgi:NH3-dependent NAD+ synthetase
MKMATAAQRATAKYQKKAYDIINLRLPKGTKERIKAHPDSIEKFSVSNFIKVAVMEKLEGLEKAPDTSAEQSPDTSGGASWRSFPLEPPF